jgi:murein L,D-transpeptidase YafK
MKRTLFWISLACLTLLGCFFNPNLDATTHLALVKTNRGKTIEDRLNEYGSTVEKRLLPFFKTAGISYPPGQLAFLGFKSEKRIDVYAGNPGGSLKWIRNYPILAASGGLGPKYREGDLQVPEGLYGINFLNPNSLYHLSMRISYPNQVDRIQAKREGRTNLGGDIMIHGRQVSIGCLAMGDEAAEDLFVLSAKTGLEKIRIVLSPIDFRVSEAPQNHSQTPFILTLYASLRDELKKFPLDPDQGSPRSP